LKFREQDLTIIYKKNIALKQALLDYENTGMAHKEKILQLETVVKQFKKNEENAEVNIFNSKEKLNSATAGLQLKIDDLQVILNLRLYRHLLII
jgi:hypothetical protein